MSTYFDRSADDGRGKLCNQIEIAEFLGVDRKTIQVWQAEGMPFAQGAGRSGSEFNSMQAVIWLFRRELAEATDESPMNKLARAKATLVDLDIQERRKEVVRMSEVEPAWVRLVSVFREGMLQLRTLAPLLDATPGIEEKEEIIDTRVREILTELSDGRWIEGDDVSGGEIRSPADEDDGIGVGVDP